MSEDDLKCTLTFVHIMVRMKIMFEAVLGIFEGRSNAQAVYGLGALLDLGNNGNRITFCIKCSFIVKQKLKEKMYLVMLKHVTQI